MVSKLKTLLKLINKVAKSDVSDAINNIIDAVNNLGQEPEYQRQMY